MKRERKKATREQKTHTQSEIEVKMRNELSSRSNQIYHTAIAAKHQLHNIVLF